MMTAPIYVFQLAVSPSTKYAIAGTKKKASAANGYATRNDTSFSTISQRSVAMKYTNKAIASFMVMSDGKIPEAVRTMSLAAILNKICPADNSNTVNNISNIRETVIYCPNSE